MLIYFYYFYNNVKKIEYRDKKLQMEILIT